VQVSMYKGKDLTPGHDLYWRRRTIMNLDKASAHPAGAKPQGFGSWAEPPNIPRF
jgi:hypothetical protein